MSKNDLNKFIDYYPRKLFIRLELLAFRNKGVMIDDF